MALASDDANIMPSSISLEGIKVYVPAYLSGKTEGHVASRHDPTPAIAQEAPTPVKKPRMLRSFADATRGQQPMRGRYELKNVEIHSAENGKFMIPDIFIEKGYHSLAKYTCWGCFGS